MKSSKLIAAIMVASATLFSTSCSDDVVDPVVPTPTDDEIETLSQQAIQEFLSFAKTPRPGYYDIADRGNLTQARNYLVAWAQKHNYQYEYDEWPNIWIDVPANSDALASVPKVILQGHIDMICASISGESYDYTKVVGEPYYDGDLLKGRVVNLGSDDGIGVGMALAIAASDVPHGPLRLLFTANEDYGMDGAINLDPSVINAEYMINIDEEEIGKISNGCLGSYLITFTKQFATSTVSSDKEIGTATVTGLRGGHSGVMINKGHLSASVVAETFISKAIVPAGGQIISIDCGIGANSIANACTVVYAVDKDKADACTMQIMAESETFQQNYLDDVNLSITHSDPSGEKAFSTDMTNYLASYFSEVTQGVIEQEESGKATKSNNIGKITAADGVVTIMDMFRAYDSQWLETEKDRFKSLAQKLGATTPDEFPYVPAWSSEGGSKFETLFFNNYKAVYPDAYTERADGGLECGYFFLKHPTLKAISVGPQLDDAHSIDEAVHVSTVKTLMRAIVNTLQHIGEVE